MSYKTIKALSRETRRKITDLLALARQNDPFFAGNPAGQRDAEWFLEVWERFGFGNGIHVRRCHYRTVSADDPPVCPNGKLYTNTKGCWNFINNASKAARYVGLVDPTLFVDRRNPDPQLYATSRDWPVEPRSGIAIPSWTLPSMSFRLESDLDLPEAYVSGYDYQLADQRYYLSVWVEKSTVDDILEPLCRRHGIDLVTGVGYQSITSVITMLRKRVNVHGKPTRIFYISDFDPAGLWMPAAVARQIEFWRREHAPDEEIKLIPLALTKEQVIRYKLPRIPIKESDRRKKVFEDRHGEGAVELDALEALHPGELGRMVIAAIEPYFDRTLSQGLFHAHSEAMDEVDDAWEPLVEADVAELEEIKAEADVIVKKYQPEAKKLQEAFDLAMKPVAERLAAVRHAIQEKADSFEVDLPDRQEPAEADVDESAWLFDSGRDYLTQLEHYTRYKGPPKNKGPKKPKKERLRKSKLSTGRGNV